MSATSLWSIHFLSYNHVEKERDWRLLLIVLYVHWLLHRNSDQQDTKHCMFLTFFLPSYWCAIRSTVCVVGHSYSFFFCISMVVCMLSPSANVDYSSTTCRLIFPSGSGPGAMRSCFIPILDDELMEDDETISIEGSTDTTVLPFTTTVVITDQEGAESDGKVAS